MSHSQFDTPIPMESIQETPPGLIVTGPLSTDPDRIRDNATISILVQITQTQTHTVASGHNVIQGVGLMRWSCPVTLQSGGFRPGLALGIATTVEQYSDPDEQYIWTWTQKLKFQ